MAEEKNSVNERNREDRIRRNVQLANRISNKVTALGMKRPPSGMGAHLSDVAIALEEFSESLDKFLSTEIEDRETLGDLFIDIKGEVEHISYHIKHLKRPLIRMADFCYEGTDNNIT